MRAASAVLSGEVSLLTTGSPLGGEATVLRSVAAHSGMVPRDFWKALLPWSPRISIHSAIPSLRRCSRRFLPPMRSVFQSCPGPAKMAETIRRRNHTMMSRTSSAVMKAPCCVSNTHSNASIRSGCPAIVGKSESSTAMPSARRSKKKSLMRVPPAMLQLFDAVARYLP